MSLVNIEKSRNLGSPVEMYKFFSDSFPVPYKFTSSDSEIVYNSETYTPVANLKRGTIELGKTSESNTISIDMDATNELAISYLQYLPPKSVWVHIYRKHTLDPDSETVLYWQGKLGGIIHSNTIATFECEPLISALSKNGLEYTYGNTCQHMLYDSGCSLNVSTYTFSGTVAGVSGYNVLSDVAATKPDGYWVTGFVTRVSNGDIKYIIEHTGNTVTLLTPFNNLANGEAITLTAGCDHAFTTCANKFSNSINFFGFPYIGNNPFEINISQE